MSQGHTWDAGESFDIMLRLYLHKLIYNCVWCSCITHFGPKVIDFVQGTVGCRVISTVIEEGSALTDVWVKNDEGLLVRWKYFSFCSRYIELHWEFSSLITRGSMPLHFTMQYIVWVFVAVFASHTWDHLDPLTVVESGSIWKHTYILLLSRRKMVSLPVYLSTKRPTFLWKRYLCPKQTNNRRSRVPMRQIFFKSMIIQFVYIQ